MADPAKLVEAMAGWLERQLPKDGYTWFDETRRSLMAGAGERPLVIAFGMAPRKLGKADLHLSPEDLLAASALRPGWDPRDWSIDQAARLCFLLATFDGDEAGFIERVQQFFRTADVGEALCLYRGLPLYPGQPRFVDRAREGARTNIRAIFEAVAHRNPYPREQFSEAAWNQMIVKALFVGTTLHPIQGLDERRNPDLARMLRDYAHERWAAGRPVSPELWRCVGVHGSQDAVDDLAHVLATGGDLERRAAALALAESPIPRAREILENAPEFASALRTNDLTWDSIRP
jgi:hypothetical protein